MEVDTYNGTVDQIQGILIRLESHTYRFHFILNILSIIINIFHLIIITRKSMRTCSVNVLMIGIAICDLCTMLTWIYKYFSLVDLEYPECSTASSLMKIYMDVTSWSSQYHFRRSGCWLGILMASVRYVIMSRMSDVRHVKLAEPKIGYILIAVVFFASGVLTVTWQYECQVVEDRNFSLAPNCAEHQDPNGHYKYSLILRPVSSLSYYFILRSYFILDATVSNFIPCIAFPILSILLLRRIRKINEARAMIRRCSTTCENDNDEKYGLTVKLIVVITVTFFIAEAPLGAIATFKTFIERTDTLFRLSTDMIAYFTILATLNSILHPTFCILMSSQYRETIKSVFRGKRKASVISVQARMSSFTPNPVMCAPMTPLTT